MFILFLIILVKKCDFFYILLSKKLVFKIFTSNIHQNTNIFLLFLINMVYDFFRKNKKSVRTMINQEMINFVDDMISYMNHTSNAITILNDILQIK